MGPLAAQDRLQDPGRRDHPVVELTARQEDKTTLNVAITASAPPLSQEQEKWLFEVNYGHIGKMAYLYLGSGLEGFVAKSILTQLNIPLEIKPTGNPIEFPASSITCISKLCSP